VLRSFASQPAVKRQSNIAGQSLGKLSCQPIPWSNILARRLSEGTKDRAKMKNQTGLGFCFLLTFASLQTVKVSPPSFCPLQLQQLLEASRYSSPPIKDHHDS
jgi:hypothetical protein